MRVSGEAGELLVHVSREVAVQAAAVAASAVAARAGAVAGAVAAMVAESMAGGLYVTSLETKRAAVGLAAFAVTAAAWATAMAEDAPGYAFLMEVLALVAAEDALEAAEAAVASL